jgi:hypothetical protein
MKPLEKEFIGIGEVRGFAFRQLEGAPVYLYEVRSESNVWYEVFEHRVHEKYQTVTYPKSPSFGVWAFSIASLEKAYQKREQMLSKDADGIVAKMPTWNVNSGSYEVA